ncbi:ComF family protein [Candidatus Falkowbacteria bacterium]|nr:ComF family protein [Candidatus Falkowbacteria bacterium]
MLIVKKKYELARDESRAYWDWLLDLLFPKKCVNCGLENNWLCDNCQKLLGINKIYRCPICHKIQIDCRVCGGCQGKSFLDGLWVLAHYSNPLIQKIIQLIKYNYISDLTFYFDKLIEEYFKEIGGWQKENILVPVPLHRQRFLWRGFNQAELICERIKAVFDNQINNQILIRKQNNKPQVKLPAGERQKNASGIFKLNNFDRGAFSDIMDRVVLVLVDDVYTTGSTMQEGAKILKEFGFKTVWGLVVARD